MGTNNSMLDKLDLNASMNKDKYNEYVKKLKSRFAALQHEVRESNLPVIIIFEGWSAAGKGSKMSEIIKMLDPRNFATYSTKPPSPDEKRKPFLWRHWLSVPPKGRFAIYDRSWYPEASNDFAEDAISENEADHRLESINRFERQLASDGVLIFKFFLHISREEQKKRLDSLAANEDTAWRVVPADYKRNSEYSKFINAYDKMIRATDTVHAPWRLIAGHDVRYSVAEIYKTIVGGIETALKAKADAKNIAGHEQTVDDIVTQSDACMSGGVPLVAMLKLKDVDLNPVFDFGEYKKRLETAQSRLFSLHNAIYRAKMPLILVYEGWDAAGKGGNIKRLTAALDPRGYGVAPISAPDASELSRPYLWRFWQALPKDGHIAIFDRSWYGRVLVERVEGFASGSEWLRAYREINEFEAELVHWGAVVVKFWLHIDSDEQLRRFTSRTENPDKQWKINDEDWRNRAKWDAYETATDDMLRLTSTEYAPWHIIESQNKRYARVKTIETLISALEKALSQ